MCCSAARPVVDVLDANEHCLQYRFAPATTLPAVSDIELLGMLNETASREVMVHRAAEGIARMWHDLEAHEAVHRGMIQVVWRRLREDIDHQLNRWTIDWEQNGLKEQHYLKLNEMWGTLEQLERDHRERMQYWVRSLAAAEEEHRSRISGGWNPRGNELEAQLTGWIDRSLHEINEAEEQEWHRLNDMWNYLVEMNAPGEVMNNLRDSTAGHASGGQGMVTLLEVQEEVQQERRCDPQAMERDEEDVGFEFDDTAVDEYDRSWRIS
jgi:hypothetical protein